MGPGATASMLVSSGFDPTFSYFRPVWSRRPLSAMAIKVSMCGSRILYQSFSTNQGRKTKDKKEISEELRLRR